MIAYQDSTTSAQIASALSYCHQYDDRDCWCSMAMSIKHELGEDGFTLWDSWGKQSNRYKESSAREVWRSVKANGGKTIKSLFSEAIKGGWKNNAAYTPPTLEQRAAIDAQNAANDLRIEAEKEAKQATMRELYTELEPATNDDCYLESKGVSAVNGLKKQGVALIVPMYSFDGVLTGLQTITTGDKKISKGSAKGHFLIGNHSDDMAVICEGLATGLSIYEATGLPVYVAFDSGNLSKIAAQITSKRLLIASDVDLSEAGQKAAIGAANAHKNAVIVSPFDFASDKADEASDFNDLARIAGNDALKAKFDEALTRFPVRTLDGFLTLLSSSEEASPQPLVDLLARADLSDLENEQGIKGIKNKYKLGLSVVRDALRAARRELATTKGIARAANRSEYVQPRDRPLNDPLSVYHPSQCKFDKEGDFSGAVGTSENLKRLYAAYDYQLRYNEMAHRIEMYDTRIGEMHASNFEMGEESEIGLSRDLANLNAYPAGEIENQRASVAMECQYHPAREWVQSKPWDGVGRFDALFDTIALADPDREAFSRLLMRKWLIAGAGALLAKNSDNFKAENVLIFADKDGGRGKTRWFESLCPPAFWKTSARLDMDSKDSIQQVTAYWLVELGELDATFKKSDIAALKGFLSSTHDTYRTAYARRESSYKRRTLYFGTVNEVSFLVDTTNERRFWPIEVRSVDYLHNIDTQQLWAEAAVLFGSGEPYWLNKDENDQIASHNEAFKQISAEEELIMAYYDPRAAGTRWLSAIEVVLEIDPTRGLLNQKQKTMFGSALGKHFDSKRHSTKRTVYHMPAKTITKDETGKYGEYASLK